MAARPTNKGAASMRRTSSLADSDVAGTFDDPGYRAAAKRRDNAQGAAYRQGQAAAQRRVQETGRRRGHQPTQVHDDPELQHMYEGGFNTELGDQRRKARSERLGTIASGGSSGAAHDGAGLVLGMVGYALFLAYLNSGWAGVKQWLSAKFLNNVPSANAPGANSRSGPGPGGSTIVPTPGGGTTIIPGPGVNAPQPGTATA